MSEIAGYLGRQRLAIVREIETMGRIPPIVAVLELKVLTDFWSLRGGRVFFTALQGRSSGYVQRGPAANWLWYDPSRDDYRDAFRSFLAREQNFRHPLPGDYHVDHVYNRARALKFGYGLVRMALVEGHVNTDHGRTYEKGIGLADAGRRAKTMKLLDAMTELKLFGISALHGSDALTALQGDAADAAAAAYGISPQQARSSISAMRDRATRRP